MRSARSRCGRETVTSRHARSRRTSFAFIAFRRSAPFDFADELVRVLEYLGNNDASFRGTFPRDRVLGLSSERQRRVRAERVDDVLRWLAFPELRKARTFASPAGGRLRPMAAGWYRHVELAADLRQRRSADAVRQRELLDGFLPDGLVQLFAL
jgi:hypothetical protein